MLLFAFQSNGLIEQLKNDILLRFGIKCNIDPFIPMHTNRQRKVGTLQFEQPFSAALHITALNLLSGLGIPLSH